MKSLKWWHLVLLIIGIVLVVQYITKSSLKKRLFGLLNVADAEAKDSTVESMAREYSGGPVETKSLIDEIDKL